MRYFKWLRNINAPLTVSLVNGTKCAVYLFIFIKDNLKEKLSLLCCATPELTFTCSKSTIEAIEKGFKYLQS